MSSCPETRTTRALRHLHALLRSGHVYLQRYKVIAVCIIAFFMWQTHSLTVWYMAHSNELKDWQNAPVIGLITAYLAALKFALEHILEQSPNQKGEDNAG